MYERTKRCADIVHVPPPTRKNPCKSILNVFKESNDTEVPQNMKQSTREWQDIQLQNFSNLRNRIMDLRSQRPVESSDDMIELPDIEDKEEWQAYCRANPPLLRVTTSILTRDIEVLLENLQSWLQETTEDSSSKSWITLWIYACLSCLFLPLEPNACSILREIAKTCRTLRGTENTSSEQNLSYSLLICIISTYFRQLDLNDTFN